MDQASSSEPAAALASSMLPHGGADDVEAKLRPTTPQAGQRPLTPQAGQRPLTPEGEQRKALQAELPRPQSAWAEVVEQVAPLAVAGGVLGNKSLKVLDVSVNPLGDAGQAGEGGGGTVSV